MTDQVSENQEIGKPDTRRLRLWVVLVLIILALTAAGIGIYYYWQNRNSDEKAAETAEDIRNVFNAPAPSSGSFTPPSPSDQYASFPPSNSTLSATSTQNNNNVDQNNIPPAYPTPRVIGNKTYRHNTWGFELTIPGDWTAQENGNKVFFYNAAGGGPIGYVEVYNNTSGETLDTLRQILEGSPSVHSVTETSFAGQPALRYTAVPSSASGVAAIYNNRIFYIHGSLTTEYNMKFSTSAGTDLNHDGNDNNNNYDNEQSSNFSNVIYY